MLATRFNINLSLAFCLGNLINCRKFVSHGSAGYLVAALSSHNTDVRAAAYNCLSRFYVHLEGSRFREKDQVIK